MNKIPYIFFGALLASPAMAENISRTMDADEAGDVLISNIAGSVEVSGWSQDSVEITGTLGDDVEELVFERDGNRCQYCWKVFDRRELNLDHVIPRHFGGRTTWENVVCSCIPCNTRKANRLPPQAGMRLYRKPNRPKWRPVISQVISRPGHKQWKDFLDVAYWNVELKE